MVMNAPAAPAATAKLAPHHAAQLAASAIDPEVIAQRGYQTAMDPTDLLDKGFAAYQCRVPALLIPICNAAGENGLYQLKPDRPRTDADGKVIKYETIINSKQRLDVPAAALPVIGDARVDLWVTEGSKKVDSLVSAGLAAIGLLGVWNWRVLSEWALFELKGRTVFIAFDSDLTDKKEVRQALTALAAFLTSLGAHVRIVRLPSGPSGEKAGVDDYLAAGHTAEDLKALAGPVVRLPLLKEDEDDRAIVRLEAALAEANERLHLSAELDRNTEIKAQRSTVRAVAWEVQSAYDAGRAEPGGWVKTWLPGIAERAGKGEKQAGVDVEAMARDGLLEKAVRPETTDAPDPETGEVVMTTRPRVYVRCPSVNEMLTRAATWQPSAPPKKPRQTGWGGKREPCPTCGSERKETRCADCGYLFSRDRHLDGHQPLGPPEPESPVSTLVPTLLHRQDDGHDPPCRRCRDAPPLPTSHLCAGCIASYADGGRLIPKG